jgi:resolvase-like protein
VTETASTRGDRPKLREALGQLQAGDTLVIYKPDRVARSMKELLVLLEDQLHARGINLHILTGICAGIHRPDGATIATRCCSWWPRWPRRSLLSRHAEPPTSPRAAA